MKKKEFSEQDGWTQNEFCRVYLLKDRFRDGSQDAHNPHRFELFDKTLFEFLSNRSF